ncbi:translation initiation factor IF-2 subunit gamma [Candidatus Micrarchaeota archaeon]|nr:translation initiation factor IF-2 subunit gamma [Candidatus Micrarchaeota archaeon]
MQPELNIGTIGHVDHGKTTLTQALSGKWADTHSEELKRGITIKLGYADVMVYKATDAAGKTFYTTNEKDAKAKKIEPARKISLIDAPGHETLMATVIAASSIMDGALFVIAANEDCPQPQTIEHLTILEASGIKNVIIVQNKVDLVSKEKALTHYKQIKQFLKGTSIEEAPIIPIAANVGVNLDSLLQAIQEHIQTPKRDEKKPPKLLVARSFDVNKPGTPIDKLKGGILGGSLVHGVLKIGDEISILPGAYRKKKNKDYYEPLKTKIIGLATGSEKLTEAKPGGLIAILTELDPALAHSDFLVGNVAGKNLPETLTEITVEVTPLKRTMHNFKDALKQNEPVILGAGTTTTVGFVESIKKKNAKIMLKKPLCIDGTDQIAILKKADNGWRLYGTAKLT